MGSTHALTPEPEHIVSAQLLPRDLEALGDTGPARRIVERMMAAESIVDALNRQLDEAVQVVAALRSERSADGERIAALLARQAELTAEVGRLRCRIADIKCEACSEQLPLGLANDVPEVDSSTSTSTTRVTAEEINTMPPSAIDALMRSLQWQADDAIINPDGDHVWLKPSYHPETGKRIGITDCCLVSNPCEHHARVAESRRGLA